MHTHTLSLSHTHTHSNTHKHNTHTHTHTRCRSEQEGTQRRGRDARHAGSLRPLPPALRCPREPRALLQAFTTWYRQICMYMYVALRPRPSAQVSQACGRIGDDGHDIGAWGRQANTRPRGRGWPARRAREAVGGVGAGSKHGPCCCNPDLCGRCRRRDADSDGPAPALRPFPGIVCVDACTCSACNEHKYASRDTRSVHGDSRADDVDNMCCAMQVLRCDQARITCADMNVQM